jgi:hypothetical protein
MAGMFNGRGAGGYHEFDNSKRDKTLSSVATGMVVVVLMVVAGVIIWWFMFRTAGCKLGTLGSVCTATQPCGAGLTCGSTGKCQSDPGQPCAGSGECVANASCISEVCALDVGMPCIANSECGEGRNCSEGVCKLSDGQSCTEAGDCAANVCENLQCGTKAGTSCTTDEDCGTGLVCESTVCKFAMNTACGAAPSQCESGTEADPNQFTGDLYCKGLFGTACEDLEDCKFSDPPLLCDTDINKGTYTCLSQVDGPCTMTEDCYASDSAIFCVENVCASRTCTTDADCQSRFDASYYCGVAGVCRSVGRCAGVDVTTCVNSASQCGANGECLGEDGAPCNTDDDCLASICDQTTHPGTCVGP